jgi:hypothetical protein
MGKRSNFERVPRDFYPTPYEAVVPLLAHLSPRMPFVEPCAGDGALARHLESAGHRCVWASDIEPRADGIYTMDALSAWDYFASRTIITNPPWSRETLHPLIEHFSSRASTWLLFDADWMHTRQSAELMRHCRKIVSVGRVKWIPDSPFTSKDNCCWYLFDQHAEAPAQFIGRAA